MTGPQAIQAALTASQHMLPMYLGDLSDADLLVRPVPAANHIAWQMGHLILSERQLVGTIPGSSYPELPAGFSEQHQPKNAASDKGFATKDEYLRLFEKTREATIANLAKVSDADLDKA